MENNNSVPNTGGTSSPPPAQTVPAAAGSFYVPEPQQKTGVGKILLIILGSILLFLGLMSTGVLIAVSVRNFPPPTLTDWSVWIVFALVMLLPLALGILLIWLGVKKKKLKGVTTVNSSNAVTFSPAATLTASGTLTDAMTTAAPVANAVPATTETGTIVTADASNVTTAPIDGQQTVTAVGGAPLNADTVNDAALTRARFSAAWSILCTLGFWVVGLLFSKGAVILLLAAFSGAFHGLRRTRGRSVACRIALGVAIVSTVVLVVLMFLFKATP